MVIVGHNYKGENFFGNLKKLIKGDIILLYSSKGDMQVYEVYDMYVVDETDMECTSQETNGETQLTLITCDKNNTKRLVVKCKV